MILLHGDSCKLQSSQWLNEHLKRVLKSPNGGFKALGREAVSVSGCSRRFEGLRGLNIQASPWTLTLEGKGTTSHCNVSIHPSQRHVTSRRQQHRLQHLKCSNG